MEIELTVVEKSDRLDRWLSQNLKDISRSHLQKLIEQGNVQVNRQICTNKKTKVNLGDHLLISFPPPQPLNLKPEPIPLDILYEDDSLIIINKPAGLVVHPAPGHPSRTLVNGLLYHFPKLAGIAGVQRPGIVHRLDKDTTGALMVAKTDYAHQHLQSQLKTKTARREYLGVVYGVPHFQSKGNVSTHKYKENGTINLPIGRHRVDRKKMAVVPMEKGGREAVTHWEVLERLGNYTLVKFLLETGRTHQIRVHSSYVGHPIVGDPLYSSKGSVGVNLPGQALHAHRLTLEHPVTGEQLEVVAPLREAFTKLLTTLRKRC
ncbi:MAG: RluA family pseudouridine synthase [cyanobacterium endosymbiont of Rhopalodia musculus]|uniref:RluA family pseudouridine synthase n=1 Tax=cyanobacterium endosymbiont of Epithemia clementina EcSB TaxID=3034674 RepID=UPI00247FB959|nr:RluA family pseudouridine synthase [cyanobacterium endosymbiont of Epithemia clementina EcSB]WGT67737.1 RluA family pseudouridine synthase [cyanobacterium endosymbiont of Epithemia clementina EcSB]